VKEVKIMLLDYVPAQNGKGLYLIAKEREVNKKLWNELKCLMVRKTS